MPDDLTSPLTEQRERRRYDTKPTPPMTLWLRLPAPYVPQIIELARAHGVRVDDYALLLLTQALTELTRGTGLG